VGRGAFESGKIQIEAERESALSGLSYQLQYQTNLTQNAWINLGNPFAASAGTLTTNDVAPSDPQRFYRLQVLP